MLLLGASCPAPGKPAGILTVDLWLRMLFPEQLREVALPLRQRRDDRLFRVGREALPLILVADEEEELVAPLVEPAQGSEDLLRERDRPADVAARDSRSAPAASPPPANSGPAP